MHDFPPYTPHEILANQLYWLSAILMIVLLPTSVWWQWSRSIPKYGTAMGWIHMITLVCVAFLWLGSGLFYSAYLSTGLLAVQLVIVIAGGIRKQIRSWGLSVMLTGGLAFTAMTQMFYATSVTPIWASWRMSCKNNMKMVGLAIHNSHEAGKFSPVTGTPLVSWRVSVLPYMDEKALWTQYDQTRAWDSEVNLPIARRDKIPFHCPANREHAKLGDLTLTDYALLTGPGTIFPAPESVLDFDKISDGTSNTILAVECSGLRIPWTQPRDVNISQVRMTIDELSPDGGSLRTPNNTRVAGSESRSWLRRV